MYGETLFTRTPEGNEALSSKNLQVLSYKVHMVLSLCDGKTRYNFLESNLKRVDNLQMIIQHLLDQNLITPVAETSRQSPFTVFSKNAPSPRPEAENFEKALERSLATPSRPSSGAWEKHEILKAIAMMNDALSEHFSDEVLEWQMQAEQCTTQQDLDLLIQAFEPLYARISQPAKARDLIKKIRQVA